MLGISFTNCTEDTEDQFGPNPEEEAKQQFSYVLNEGAQGANNANISGFVATLKDNVADKELKALGDLYYKENQKQMGDVANAIVMENENIYVVMYDSKYIGKLDLKCKEEARYTFPQGEGKPRCIDVGNDYVYVTQDGGQVSKINVTDMTLVNTIQIGDNLEGIVEKDGKLYVANAYKRIYDFNDEVFVIDAKTMTLEKTLKVALNPTDIYEIHDKIYILSKGDYTNVPAVLQVFEPSTGTVKQIPQTENIEKLTGGDNKLIYGVRSIKDENWIPTNSFFTCTAKADKVSETSFLKDVPAALKNANIYFIEMDEDNGYIYIGTTDYTTNGQIYQFDSNGNFIQSFDSGGINPKAMIFID